jgi:hypothetical protein
VKQRDDLLPLLFDLALEYRPTVKKVQENYEGLQMNVTQFLETDKVVGLEMKAIEIKYSCMFMSRLGNA